MQKKVHARNTEDVVNVGVSNQEKKRGESETKKSFKFLQQFTFWLTKPLSKRTCG